MAESKLNFLNGEGAKGLPDGVVIELKKRTETPEKKEKVIATLDEKIATLKIEIATLDGNIATLKAEMLPQDKKMLALSSALSAASLGTSF